MSERVTTERAREMLAAPYVAYIPDAHALRGIGQQDAGDAARVERDVHDLAADLIDAREELDAGARRIERQREALEAHASDLRDAAGELCVGLPYPGTDAAKLLRANAIMRADRDALRRELDALRQTHAGELARERERAEAAERECVGVDRIISAWESIARAYRIDPSPANAERIATLATCAADVRDDAIAQRDAAIADAAGLRAATSPAVATWAPVIDAMQCESYSLLSTLRVLTDATEHLLRDHDCDAHGWEVYGAAAKAGRATLDTLAAAGAASSGMVPAWPTTDALAAGATGRGDGGDDETKGATT